MASDDEAYKKWLTLLNEKERKQNEKLRLRQEPSIKQKVFSGLMVNLLEHRSLNSKTKQ